MADLQLYESGDGGDLIQLPNGMAQISGAKNEVYLALFGGDPEGSKWWADKTLHKGTPSRHYKSLTNQVLRKVVLNSAGRVRIEEAANKDLEYLKTIYPGTEIEVQVVIESHIRCAIIVQLNGEELSFYWMADSLVVTTPGTVRRGVNYDIVENTLIVY